MRAGMVGGEHANDAGRASIAGMAAIHSRVIAQVRVPQAHTGERDASHRITSDGTHSLQATYEPSARRKRGTDEQALGTSATA